MARQLSVDDLTEVVTGALSTVLSRVSSNDAVAQGSSAQSSSQAHASTPRQSQLFRTQQAQRPQNELEDEVPPLPPPLPILNETRTK